MVKFFKEYLGIYSLIIAVSVAVHFKCVFYGITNADDDVLIVGNIPFLQHFPNLLKVFTTDAFYLVKSIDLYRPLQSATFILDAQWGNNTVFNAHLTNLLLHVVSCLTVYHLLLRLDFKHRLALVGALVYAVHYNFMTAVAWLPARGDLLLGLCTFLAMLTFIKSLENRGWSNILLHLIFFTLALFSKESAVVLPFLFVIYLFTYDKTGLLHKKHFVLPMYYIAIGSMYWVLKEAAVAVSSDGSGVIPFIKNLRILPETVARFYLPVNISTLPAYKLSATLSGAVLISSLLLLHFYWRKCLRRQALFYPAWFLLFILPSMTYYPNFYSFCNDHIDHRSYVICFGLLMITLNVIHLAAIESKKIFALAVFLLLVYLAALNLYFSRSYKNPIEFALRAIRTESNSTLAYSNYGIEKYKQGEDLEALRFLNASLRICDKFMPALHYRARIFRMRGMSGAALADLDNIFSVDPEYDASDYALRGIIKADMQDPDGAKSDFESALRLNPTQVDAINGLHELHIPGGAINK
ncbi:MAG: glycosyltransferase family 39 protein [Desulfuromonadales bacterium]